MENKIEQQIFSDVVCVSVDAVSHSFVPLVHLLGISQLPEFGIKRNFKFKI